jgi:excisionase family DNA binding protein
MSEQDQALAEKPRQLIPEKWADRTSFTVDEAAELLGVSRPTAYARSNDGRWKVFRPSKRVIRVPRWFVEQTLAAGC